MFDDKKKFLNYDIDVIDLKLLEMNEYYHKPPRRDRQLTEKGKNLIKDYPSNRIRFIDYLEKMNDNQNEMFVNIKESLLDKYDKRIKSLRYQNDLLKMNNEQFKNILKIYENRKQILNDLHDLELFSILNIDYKKLRYVRLLDYFEIVSFHSITASDINSDGDYPLISAKNKDNGIMKYTNYYNIDTKNKKYISINKQGSIGHCYIHSGKFTATSSVLLIRIQERYEKIIDIEITKKLLSLQLMNMNFNYSNPINKSIIKSIKVYLLV